MLTSEYLVPPPPRFKGAFIIKDVFENEWSLVNPIDKYQKKPLSSYKEKTKPYAPGYYYLITDIESEPTLVRGYFCDDMGGQFVFGFNAADGGAIMPAWDLTRKTAVVPVKIVTETEYEGRYSNTPRTVVILRMK